MDFYRFMDFLGNPSNCIVLCLEPGMLSIKKVFELPHDNINVWRLLSSLSERHIQTWEERRSKIVPRNPTNYMF